MGRRDKVQPANDGEIEGMAAAGGRPVGIVKKRKCRDVIFLVIFIVYWVGMFIIAASAVASGDPRRLISPLDYNNQYCGFNNTATNSSQLDLSKKPYLYFLDPISLAVGVCVTECPTATALTTTSTSVICKYSAAPTSSNVASLIAAGTCSTYVYKSSPVLNRCTPLDAIPTSLIDQTSSAGNTTVSNDNILTSGRSYAMQVLTDLTTTWPVLATFAAISLVICLIWMFLLQWLAGLFVWFTLIATNAVLIGTSIWLYFYWQTKNTAYTTSGATSATPGSVTILAQTTSAQNEVTAALVAFIVCAIIALVMLLVTIALLNRIRIAVQIIKESSRALISMPLIVLFPMWIYAFIAGLMVYFVIILLYIITPSGPVSISVINQVYTDPNISQQMLWYHLAGFIWGFTFLVAINQITIAGAVAEWYWLRDKSTRKRFPVLRSFARVCRYHLGSVALGSLLLTIVELIRVVLWQLQRYAKRTHNKTMQYFVACLQCCLKCFEVILKFINKNAYIYIAITGKAFFKAASEASSLLIRNALRLATVDFVADFVLFLSKLFVTVLSAFLSYLWLTYRTDLYGSVKFPFITVLLVGVEAYMVSTAFFSVFNLAIDTIFLSFLEDSEKNDGSAERPFYMSDNLRRIIGKTEASEPNQSKRGKGNGNNKAVVVNEF
ncbi:plasma-membrane choline transporter-domain-containing protein [Entophlyctis helioformis]|nr:plasma-membrane choline transporter-domain-containing protein [Entophlyctis helioformis]